MEVLLQKEDNIRLENVRSAKNPFIQRMQGSFTAVGSTKPISTMI
ncbi:hypothetical protein [Phnomibacter ginsenosidimutans]|nr:hypothetical protein [Phnomibacter ginsenosidimutans]